MTSRGPFQPQPFRGSVILWKQMRKLPPFNTCKIQWGRWSLMWQQIPLCYLQPFAWASQYSRGGRRDCPAWRGRAKHQIKPLDFCHPRLLCPMLKSHWATNIPSWVERTSHPRPQPQKPTSVPHRSMSRTLCPPGAAVEVGRALQKGSYPPYLEGCTRGPASVRYPASYPCQGCSSLH